MQKEQKSKHNSFFFLLIGLIAAGMIFFLSSSLWAQGDEGARLEWVAGQRIDPVVVPSHEAVFQITLIDPNDRAPDRFVVKVWIDTDDDGLYGANEKIPLEEVVPDSGANLSERRYVTTIYFDSNKHIQSGTISNFEKLPESFETIFCFSFELDGNPIPHDDVSHSPTDPNNQLIVLNKNCDTDGDGIKDLEEGAGLLPASYCPDTNYAYRDKTLAALMTSGGKIAVKIDKGWFRKVHMVPENDANRPDETILNLTFPYGFIFFRIDGREASVNLEEVELKILFPTPITNYAEFCRYSKKNWFSPIEYSYIRSDYDRGDAWRYEDFSGAPEMQRRSLMLKLEDNNPKFDSNEEVDIIDDPLGLGIPRESSGEGRCFISCMTP